MNGWHAALAALLFVCPRVSSAADDLPSAARELARKTAVFLGARAPAAVSYRNRSSLPDVEVDRVRREFEAALPPPREGAPPPWVKSEARITLSESASEYLLVEEARKDEESQTWISAWNRTAPVTPPPSGLALDRKLVWEQADPILDLAFWDAGMLVLSPSRLTLYARQGTEVAPRQTVSLTSSRSWPRDPRGRLRKSGPRIEVFLPGVACQGVAEPTLSLDCRSSSDPWVLESGSRALLLANFAAEHNYFDGRVVLQNGTRKSVAPFYSAAAAEEAGGIVWLLAMVDGQTQMFNPAWESVAAIPSWGSDIVGVSGSCGGSAQVLATRSGPESATQADTLQAFSIGNHAALPASAPMPFAGVITALWPASSGAALAVVHDPVTRKYAAYLVSLLCGS